MTITTTQPRRLRDVIRANSAAKAGPAALPAAPPDWRDQAVALLGCPGLDPHDAAEVRKWIAWRTLPPKYWRRLREMGKRVGAPGFHS